MGVFIASTSHHAYIGWEVDSTHFSYNVEIVVYVDGKQAFTYEGLPPGYYVWNTTYYVYNFPIWVDSKVIEVKAVSFGGGLGTQTDSQTIIVHNGGTYNLNFKV